jgi:hypothetical protein
MILSFKKLYNHHYHIYSLYLIIFVYFYNHH